jgi:DMSO/TMAO reductase YedYZ molybdopterin-dependent catalytic subunit
VNQQELTVLDELPVHGADPSDGRGDYVVVEGQVARRRTFLPSDLAALPEAAVTESFRCEEGWVVPDLRWRGVSLAAVLDAVGADPATECVEVSSGSYSTVLSRADAERALLALWLNEAPLTVEHGGPVRLVIPGKECFTSVKWVDRIRAYETTAAAPAQAIARAIARARS